MPKRRFTDKERIERKRLSRKRWKKNNPIKVTASNKKYYKNNAEKLCQQNGEYCKNHREMYIANNKRWEKANPEKVKNKYLKATYNITIQEYNRMFKEQGGCCFICGSPQAQQKRALEVDHNHKTGKIRGLLCTLCNRGLGLFEDNILILQNAITYLKIKD